MKRKAKREIRREDGCHRLADRSELQVEEKEEEEDQKEEAEEEEKEVAKV